MELYNRSADNLPMDDASVAERLSKVYKDAGKDPNMAFDQEALAEFGFFPEGGD